MALECNRAKKFSLIRLSSDISSLPIRSSKIYYVMKVRNESDVPYQVTQNTREKTTIDLLPNQSYQFPLLPENSIVGNFIEFSFVNGTF